MKRFIYCIIAVVYTLSIYSQDSWEDFRKQAYQEHATFREKALTETESFRQRANAEYLKFIENAWKEYNGGTIIDTLQDERVPPVVIRDEDKNRELKDHPVVIEEEITIPEPTPTPKPIVPTPKPIVPQKQISVLFYGTTFTIGADPTLKFHLKDVNNTSLSAVWETFAEGKYDPFIVDCLRLKAEHHLCDWSYLRLVTLACETFLGKGTPEAELLKAFVFQQSGYQMRLAVSDKGQLLMLYGTPNMLYNRPYWEIDGCKFYTDVENVEHISICTAAYPSELPMSFYINQEQQLLPKITAKRQLQSTDVKWMSAEVAINKNLIDLMNDYPTSQIGEEVMTRWAIYANTPLSAVTKDMLYPQLREMIKGRDESDRLNILLHWVQTSLVYEYDDKVWGHDRAFFAEETLYYPYADCEDRSILFSRLVRDLLGLRVALVYYPGHLATAVETQSAIKGDYLNIGGKRFIVCDPTYIGAPIGLTMPNMDNSKAKVIVLK